MKKVFKYLRSTFQRESVRKRGRSVCKQVEAGGEGKVLGRMRDKRVSARMKGKVRAATFLF